MSTVAERFATSPPPAVSVEDKLFHITAADYNLRLYSMDWLANAWGFPGDPPDRARFTVRWHQYQKQNGLYVERVHVRTGKKVHGVGTVIRDGRGPEYRFNVPESTGFAKVKPFDKTPVEVRFIRMGCIFVVVGTYFKWERESLFVPLQKRFPDDDKIDTSDIPEATPDFFRNAKLVMPGD